MSTRCNRGFYCRSYCLLNISRPPLCPSSRAQEYYTVVAACGILRCGFQVAGLVWSWGLCVRFAGCCSILQTGHITLTRSAEPRLCKWGNTTYGRYCYVLRQFSTSTSNRPVCTNIPHVRKICAKIQLDPVRPYKPMSVVTSHKYRMHSQRCHFSIFFNTSTNDDGDLWHIIILNDTKQTFS